VAIYRHPLAWKLDTLLMQAAIPTTGLFKTRVVYDNKVVNVEFVPYQVKSITSLKLVEADLIYPHKYENREALNDVFQKRGPCDEVIILQNGFITDTTYANLVFKKDNKWFTPTTCLLEGTMRAHLLAEGRISETEIHVDNLYQYKSCKLINALLGMEAPEIPVSAIL